MYKGRNEGAGKGFCSLPLAGAGAKRPLRRRRHAKVGMGGEGQLERSTGIHPHPYPPPSRGEGNREVRLSRAWGLGHFRVQVARYLMAGGNLL